MNEPASNRPTPRPATPPAPASSRSETIEQSKLQRSSAKTSRLAPTRLGRTITGRLEAHGPAKYQFQADGSPSYFVKIVSTRGVETIWGVDLERAIKRSKTQPKIGSVIGIQRVGSELVALPSHGSRQRTARRAQWRVETITFFAEAMQRARRSRESQLADRRELREYPELRSAFISLQVARKFAEAHIRDRRDREIFITRVKAVMTLSAREGKPIPETGIIERQPTRGRDDPAR